MKQAAAIFATIFALLLGVYWVVDGASGDYYHHSEPAELIAGLVLIAAGLTAVFLERRRRLS